MDKKLIETIKNKNNIIDVISSEINLIKKGRNFWAICPFHEDTNPSMSISQEKQIYKCFVCNASGNVFSFLMDYKKIPFQTAVRILGERVGITVADTYKSKYSEKQLKAFEVMNEAYNFFSYNLNTDEGQEALKYLQSRGLDMELIEEFALGYAPKKGLKEFLLNKKYEESLLINLGLINDSGYDFFSNRIIFTLKDQDGNIVGFSGRTLDNKGSKYINSPETFIFNKSKILYNYNNAINEINKQSTVFINEGFMDVIAMNKADIKNSLAIMGTALTKLHLSSLKNVTVNLMLDGDNAGQNATIKSIRTLIESKIKTYVIVNNTKLDPDEIFTKYGKEELIKIIDNKIPAIEYIYNLHLSKFKKLDSSEIELFITSFSKYLKYQNNIERKIYINKMAELFKLDIPTIESECNFNNYTPITKVSQPVKKERVYKKSKDRNYTYELILSLIKNANNKAFMDHFMEFFNDNKIYFYQHIEYLVVKNILNIYQKKPTEKVSDEERLIIQKANKNKDFITNKDDLEDLINNVNEFAKKEIISKIKLKLKDKGLSSKEKMSLLKKLQEIEGE